MRVIASFVLGLEAISAPCGRFANLLRRIVCRLSSLPRCRTFNAPLVLIVVSILMVNILFHS
jgi:hypothetical protein